MPVERAHATTPPRWLINPLRFYDLSGSVSVALPVPRDVLFVRLAIFFRPTI